MTNELKLPAEELVRGYHDLWRIERAFRSMKSLLEIEPVYHRTSERITSHVHLCVLAYLFTRLAENRTYLPQSDRPQVGESWEWTSGLASQPTRERLEQISLSQIETDRATILKTKRLTAEETSFLKR